MGSSLELTISYREMKILFLIVCLSILANQHISQASEEKDILAKSSFGEVDLLSKLTEVKQKIKRSAKNKKKKRNKKQRKAKKFKKSRKNKQRKNKQSRKNSGRKMNKNTRSKKADNAKKSRGKNKKKQRKNKKQSKRRNKGKKRKSRKNRIRKNDKNKISKRKLSMAPGNNEPKTVLHKTRKGLTRKPYKGQHCEYIDLCGLKTKSANGCDSGMKFVVKGSRTNGIKVRRQFLNPDDKMIIVFLEQGKKIMDCTNGSNTLQDVTNQVTCTAITGAEEIKLVEKQNTTSPSPAPAPPTECPGTCNIPSTTLTSNPVVKCPCPEGKTCITTIKSNAFEHTVTCGSKTVTKQCGGPLLGTKKGILVDIQKYNHPLCADGIYSTLIKDLDWSCQDLTISPCNVCPGATPPPYPPVPCPSPPTPPSPPSPPTPPPPTPSPPTPPSPPSPSPPTPPSPPSPSPPTPSPPTPSPAPTTTTAPTPTPAAPTTTTPV